MYRIQRNKGWNANNDRPRKPALKADHNARKSKRLRFGPCSVKTWPWSIDLSEKLSKTCSRCLRVPDCLHVSSSLC